MVEWNTGMEEICAGAYSIVHICLSFVLPCTLVLLVTICHVGDITRNRQLVLYALLKCLKYISIFYGQRML